MTSVARNGTVMLTWANYHYRCGDMSVHGRCRHDNCRKIIIGGGDCWNRSRVCREVTEDIRRLPRVCPK